MLAWRRHPPLSSEQARDRAASPEVTGFPPTHPRCKAHPWSLVTGGLDFCCFVSKLLLQNRKQFLSLLCTLLPRLLALHTVDIWGQRIWWGHPMQSVVQQHPSLASTY